MKRLVTGLILLILVACTRTPPPGDPNAFLTPQNFGTAGYDAAFGLAPHNTGVYVAGLTTGDLDGPQVGEVDAFVRKYDRSGKVLWAQQFGTETVEGAFGAASDAHDNVYVVGQTYGSLGGPNSGCPACVDTFLRKYSARGKVLWTRQFGYGQVDSGYESAVAVSGDDVYVVGQISYVSRDVFIKKLDANGVEQWTQLFSPGGDTSSNVARGVAVDKWGNAYVVGTTFTKLDGSGPGIDAFIRKYTPSGRVAWSKQLDYSYVDYAMDVAVNGKSVYLAGFFGPQNQPPNSSDAFVIKFDTSGKKLWYRSFDLRRNDRVQDVSASSQGVVLAGTTTTEASEGSSSDDGFVYAFDRGGDYRWSRLLATSESDNTSAVLATPFGVFAAGSTFGTLGTSNYGDADAYLTRLKKNDGSTIWTD